MIKEETQRLTMQNDFEYILTLLSGMRIVTPKNNEDISYNNALGDVYDYILNSNSCILLENTVKQGKWIRD